MAGSRLKVLAGGLHELSARCESLGGTLSNAVASPLTAVSTWQANADVVNVACAGSRKSLAVLAGRMQATGAKYAEAGTGYTATNDDGAARLRGLLG
jgi:hypothetical protein